MKKIFTLLAFFACASVLSQGKIAEKVADYKRTKATFKHFSVLDAAGEPVDATVSKAVDKATIATIKTASVNAIVAEQNETIEVEIPYLGGVVNVQLYKVEIFNEGFHLDTDKSKNVPYQKGVYYRGIVKDDAKSVVALNFFNNELSGVISSESLSNVVIGKLQKSGNSTDYIVYADADLKILNDFDCAAKDDPENAHEQFDQESVSNRSELSTRCVTTYFEIDYDLYLANGSDINTTANWITSVFNNVSTLYANDGITTSLRSLLIWTEDDPYTGSNSSDYLSQFNVLRPAFDGDVGQLIGIDPGGLGGLAVAVYGLCSANNFSYSDVNFAYSSVPTYSWTVMAVAHELGHLFGSAHTHACVWNGNFTPIDNCGPSMLGPTSEGYSCITSPPTIPSTVTKGTLMSYCHLVSGVGINFANGFGPQPAARMLSSINAATCLSTDCVTTCINTVADITSIATSTSLTVNWTDTGATSWQVAISTFASVTYQWQTANATTYTFNNLTANTYYKIRIRPVCSAGMTPFMRSVPLATSTTWCEGATIADTGGASGNYTNDQRYVRVLIPTQANKKIRMTLTSFDLENNHDFLYVYDGPNTSAPDLTNGGKTGENLSGPFAPFISSSPDGAMTLRFFSDSAIVKSGYAATIACDNLLGTGEMSNIDFSYYPNPSKDEVNIVSKNEITGIEVYNVAGQLLYNSKTSTLETKVDISSYSTGTYFFKLKFGEIAANFKILKL